MTPSRISEKVVTERVAWVRQMLQGIRTLPVGRADDFFADARNVAAAESYLRRALEALLDLGRHLLARGFGRPANEYKEVARILHEEGVLDLETATLLAQMAGYRNRMVHFYDEVSGQELLEICTTRLGEVEAVTARLTDWIRRHPEKVDRSL